MFAGQLPKVGIIPEREIGGTLILAREDNRPIRWPLRNMPSKCGRPHYCCPMELARWSRKARSTLTCRCLTSQLLKRLVGHLSPFVACPPVASSGTRRSRRTAFR